MLSRKHELIISHILLWVIIGYLILGSSNLRNQTMTIGHSYDEILQLNKIYHHFTCPLESKSGLYYILLSKYLGLIKKQHNVGPWFDYQLGLSYFDNEQNYQCLIRYDKTRGGVEAEVFQDAAKRLRYLNTVLFASAILFLFLAARSIFVQRPILALSIPSLIAAIPLANVNSLFISNKNMHIFLASLIFLLLAIILNTLKNKQTLNFYPIFIFPSRNQKILYLDFLLATTLYILALLSLSYTFNRLSLPIEDCNYPLSTGTPAGGEVIAASNDTSELILFDRLSGILEIQAQSGKIYETIYKSNPQLGKPFERVLAGNITRDNQKEILFWNPFTNIFRVINEEKTIKEILILTSSKTKSIPLLGDITGNNYDDILLFVPEIATWYIYLNPDEHHTLTFGYKHGTPFIFNSNKENLLAVYDDETKQLALRNYNLQIEKEFELNAYKNVFPFDYNDDGIDDLISWEDGARCLTIFITSISNAHKANSPLKNYSFKKLKTLCPISPNKLYRFDNHQKLLTINSTNTKYLARFDYRSSELTLLFQSNSELQHIYEYPELTLIKQKYYAYSPETHCSQQFFRTLGAE
jgi:hypothetical protein